MYIPTRLILYALLLIYKSTKLSTIPNNFRPTTSRPLVYLLLVLLEGYSGSAPMNLSRSYCLAKPFPNITCQNEDFTIREYFIFIALCGLLFLLLFIFDSDDLLSFFLFQVWLAYHLDFIISISLIAVYQILSQFLFKVNQRAISVRISPLSYKRSWFPGYQLTPNKGYMLNSSTSIQLFSANFSIKNQ